MRENPFWLPSHKRTVGRYEFDWFQELAQTELKRHTKDFERFKILEDAYGVTTSFSDEDCFQISFMKRKMGRRDFEGNQAVENGADLLYSLGPQGQVATVLYGATSNFASMNEKLIYLRIGHYSAHQLKRRLRRDIHDLVAYAYCSSIDLEPTFRERARVWFLRRFHPLDIDDKFSQASGNKWVSFAIDFTLRTLLMVLLKPIGIAVAIAFLALFGFDYLAQLISH
ncbi:hypothetical protein [uncultured Roseibium sp.]|uniref:hypothetical protein n=1 Tax=uncultured Roseibium sp. TaxID=1936171 RepID=UPI003217C87D